MILLVRLGRRLYNGVATGYSGMGDEIRGGIAATLRWQNRGPAEIVLPAEEVGVQGKVVRVIIELGR